jgi:hypothetical protein
MPAREFDDAVEPPEDDEWDLVGTIAPGADA